MPANYLHGVEIIPVNVGGRAISVVKSAVIGLIGYAPTGPVNKLTLVRSASDAAQFGGPLNGFNIPQALKAIYANGNATVLVVNVFDKATMKETATSETKTVTNGKFQSTYSPISDAVVKNNAGDITYVAGTDYVHLGYGVYQSKTIANGDTVKLTYDYNGAFDDVSAYEGGASPRTGVYLFEEAITKFGFSPKIFLFPMVDDSPDFSQLIIDTAEKHKGVSFLSSGGLDTVSEAITARGVSGALNTSSKRIIVVHGHRTASFGNPRTSGGSYPLSLFAAGVMANVDIEEGYWVSPSNHEYKGLTGTEKLLTAAINDPSCDVNTLNEAGFMTTFEAYGTGTRLWGNRNASFPLNTGPETFISVVRTADIIDDSIVYAMMPILDKPINNALIDTVTETVNAFLRKLQGQGAIIDGNCWYDPANNPPEELANGHITFDYDFLPPSPAERVTFRRAININYYKNLGA